MLFDMHFTKPLSINYSSIDCLLLLHAGPGSTKPTSNSTTDGADAPGVIGGVVAGVIVVLIVVGIAVTVVMVIVLLMKRKGIRISSAATT